MHNMADGDTPRGYPTLNHPDTPTGMGEQPTLALGDITDDDPAILEDALHHDATPDTSVPPIMAQAIEDMRESHSSIGGKTIVLEAGTPAMMLPPSWFRQALGIRASSAIRIASDRPGAYGGPLITDGVWEPQATHTGAVWVMSDLPGTSVTAWEIIDV